MNIAVVDSGANLVAFLRMDGAQLASIAISEHKARTAAKFRRPTKVFEKAIQESDMKYMLTLDDVVASRGGIPLIEDGKIIGASVVPAAQVRRTKWSATRPPRWSSSGHRARRPGSAVIAENQRLFLDPGQRIGTRDGFGDQMMMRRQIADGIGVGGIPVSM